MFRYYIIQGGLQRIKQELDSVCAEKVIRRRKAERKKLETENSLEEHSHKSEQNKINKKTLEKKPPSNQAGFR